MLNSALFGGAVAREALQKSMFDDEQSHVGLDWCVGGCPDWHTTDEGRGRMEDLRQRFQAWGAEHPKEYATLVKEGAK